MFDKIKILNHFSNNFFNEIFVINNLRILTAYEILINYYTMECITNYMSMVNKTKTIFCECIYFTYFIQNDVCCDHNCHLSRIIESMLYFKCATVL